MAHKFHPGHYCQAFQGRDEPDERYKARIERYLSAPEIKGIKMRTTWRYLEPARDQYRFDEIEKVLRWVKAAGKRLSISVVDRSFSRTGTARAGVIYPQYVVDAGWCFVSGGDGPAAGKLMPALYDAVYTDRYIALWSAIVARYDTDPAVEHFDLIGETSMGQPVSGRRYSLQSYTDNLIRLGKTVSNRARETLCIIGVNFLGGASSPHITRLLNSMKANKVALGWPDPLFQSPPIASYQWAEANKNAHVIAPDCDASFMKYDPGRGINDVPAVVDMYHTLGATHIYWQPVIAGGRATDLTPRQAQNYFDDGLLAGIRSRNAKIHVTRPEGW